MLYLFTGNNRYQILEEAQKWKTAFGEKYGVENVTHITSLESITKGQLSETLTSRGLFTQKRLVIIDGFPFSGEKVFSGATEIENTILHNLERIPEEVLVVFLSVNPDKRKSGYKQIVKNSQVKDFSISGDSEVFSILSKKYSGRVDTNALQKVIFLKGGDLQKSVSEIEKLLVAPLQIISGKGPHPNPLPRGEGINHIISLRDIEAHIIPEFEESIFVFIDTLLQKDRKKIFQEFENLLQFSNLYALYQSIIVNLRVFLYIELLKLQNNSPGEISDILKLGNRAFLVNKRHASSFPNIQKLYTDLLNFDKNMKFGKFISSDENDLKKELERVFIKFIK